MATKFQRDTMSANIMQHLDSGGRQAMMMKETPSSAAVSVSGNCPFWSVDLGAVPVPDEQDAGAEPTVVCEFKRGRLALSRRSKSMPYTSRHIDADELIFIHRGRAKILTEFGQLDAPTGRFIFVTRGAGYRVLPETDDYIALVYSSEEHVILAPDVEASSLPIKYPDLNYTATEQNATNRWEERLRTESWSLTAVRDFDPVRTRQVMKSDHPVFAIDLDDIPAHSPTAPHPGMPFIMIKGPYFHLEVAKRSDPLPFYHRNVRANETQFVHVGRGDRDTDLGFRSAGVGTLNNYPKGIEHSVANRPSPCVNLIWETSGDVVLNPAFTEFAK